MTFPECEQFTNPRKKAICRGEVTLPLEGPHGINSYRRLWGLEPLPALTTAQDIPTVPPLWIRGVNFASAMWDHAADGFRRCSQSEIDKRLAICQTCPEYSGGKCSKCGCPCNAANQLINKLALRSSACELGKWGALPPANNPALNTVPVHSYAKFNRDPDRHLIYFIWPKRGNNIWQWNVERLLERIELFNGVRTVAIALDTSSDSVDAVKEAFKGVRIDNWIVKNNDPIIGEGIAFIDMMKTLPVDSGVTFYGHAKGVKYDPPRDVVTRWCHLLYKSCLDNWSAVKDSLEQFPITGSMKRFGDFDFPSSYRWHYSGTFFWFRNADIFSSPKWDFLQPGFYGCVEAWPGFLMPYEQSGVLIGDNAGWMYTEQENTKWEEALENWPSDSVRAGNPVSDRRFFNQSLENESWDNPKRWNELVDLHSKASAALKQMGCKSIVECGSGHGPFILAADRDGLDAMGFDANRFCRDFAIKKGVDPNQYQLCEIAEFRFSGLVDAVYCVEVFEHCHDRQLIPFCEQLATNCEWLYFSSTCIPATNDHDWGHVNMKPRDEWIAWFSRFGMEYVRDATEVVPWGMLFRSNRPLSGENSLTI